MSEAAAVPPPPDRGPPSPGPAAEPHRQPGTGGAGRFRGTGRRTAGPITDYTAWQEQDAREQAVLEREKKIQTAMLDIKKKHGKNAILKGMNLEEGATAREQNRQIGGHKA